MCCNDGINKIYEHLNGTTHFFYKQHQAEISKKQAKSKQNLSSALRLNFCFLKIIRLFHPWYHPKIVGHILKTCMKPSVSVLMKLYDKKNNKKVCIIRTVRILYSSVIKHVHII